MSKGETAFNEDALANVNTTHYLTLGATAVGFISSSTDKDWFEVYLEANVPYAAAALGQDYPPSSAVSGTTLRLFNSAGNELAPSSTLPGGIGFSVTQAGFYYVQVEGASSATGSYIVQLARNFSDDHGADANTASTIVSGVAKTGALQVAGDNDAFLLSVETGKRYFYYVTTNMTNLVYTVDTIALQRVDFGLLVNGMFGEVISQADTTVLLSLAANDSVSTGTYKLFAQEAISTDKALKIGNAAANSINGTANADELWGFDGNDTLLGAGGLDILVGGKGVDKLNGGGAADRMIGGPGNDLYFVDTFGAAAKDVVEEKNGTTGGIDQVSASVGYTLPANVENLVLTGTAGAGTGNGAANVITGNSAANVLSGLDGADTLNGGGGGDTLNGGLKSDTLNGGAGKDKFVFNAPLGTGNVDKILAFSHADDTILLSKGIFKNVTPSGAKNELTPGQLAAFGAAPQADDRILYKFVDGPDGNKTPDTIQLFYDANGGSRADAVLFATLTNQTSVTLTPSDFVIVG